MNSESTQQGPGGNGDISTMPRFEPRPSLPPANARIAKTTPAEKPLTTISESGELQRLSVSTIQTFGIGPDSENQPFGCERAFWFDKKLHLPKKQFKSQLLGTEIHAQFERYLGTGQMVLGDIALAAKHLLPAPNEPHPGSGFLVAWGAEHLLLEHPFKPEDPNPLMAGGVPLLGYIDVVNLRRLPTEGVVRVTDFKTSKNIDAVYDGKPAISSPADLVSTRTSHGIQMIGYAKRIYQSLPADRVELEHIYVQTQGRRRAESVLAEVSRQQADDEWGRVDERIPRMREVARAKSLDDVAPNWGHCNAYGGCPFRANCLHYQSTKGAPKPMGLLDRLKTANAATAAAPTPPPAAAPATPPAVVTTFVKPPERAPAPVGKLYADQAIQGHTYLLHTGQVGKFLCATSGKFSFATEDGSGPVLLLPEALIAETFAQVLPPDAPKSDPLKAADVPSAAALADAPPEVQQAAAQLQAAQQAAQALQQPPAEDGAEKPKRKRRTKAEMETDAAAAMVGEITAQIARGLECADEAPPRLQVFVNAIPTGAYESLAGYVAERKAEIEAGFEVEDIRLAPKKDRNGQDNPLAFGGWRAVLAKVIKASPPPPGTYVLIAGDAPSEINQVAIEALEGLCAAVPGSFVRGVR